MGGATKEHSWSTAKSLSRNRYIKANFHDRHSVWPQSHHSPFFIVPSSSQPRGAEQRPCTHDKGFALAGPDHPATDKLLPHISNKKSGMPVNRTFTGHLPLAHLRRERLEEQLPVGITVTGSSMHCHRLHNTRCSRVFCSNHSCIESGALYIDAQPSF